MKYSETIINKLLEAEIISECKLCECGEVIVMNNDTFIGIQKTSNRLDYELSLHNCPGESCTTTKSKRIKK